MDWVQRALEHAQQKVNRNISVFGDRMPDYTVDGKYRFVEDGGWTGSFWTGILWSMYEYTADKRYLEAARLSQKRLVKRLIEHPASLDHDTGFLYILAFVADYKLTGNGEARRTALKAADCLAERYCEKGRFIRAWNDWPDDASAFREEKKRKAIVDSMMNIPLLFWDHQQTGEEKKYNIAAGHAKTIRNTIIRKDFSTYHTVNFDLETGECTGGKTFQGNRDESCWSRGQAWAVYGFSLAFRYTKLPEFLEAAKGTAEYFIRMLPGDFVPVWDFDFKDDMNAERDTSAASIFASGLLELAKLEEDERKRNEYRNIAISVTKSLSENFTSQRDEEEGILLHGCSHNKRGLKDNSLIYGDYFYVEALLKLLCEKTLYW